MTSISLEREQEQIEQLVSSLYKCISFDATNTPNWADFRALFQGRGRIIDNSQDAPIVYNVESFAQTLQEQIDTGDIPSFYQHEVGGETHFYGSIASHASHFEGKPNKDSTDVYADGTTLLQLIKENSKWYITSMIWNGFVGK
jgi:hypothetical protein